MSLNSSVRRAFLQPLLGNSEQRAPKRVRRQLGKLRFQSGRGRRLKLEQLEERVVLNGSNPFAPMLTVVGNQMVDEGTELVLIDVGTFTDAVPTSSSSVGLNPAAFASLGAAFNPATNVTINTSGVPQMSGGASFTGTTVAAVSPTGIAYEIAVFTFDTFSLASGRTITASGSRPLALLSKNDLVVGGTINVSALDATPGAGGGAGATTNATNGQPAPGAPSTGAGTGKFISGSLLGGGGGAFGGNGGFGSSNTGDSSRSAGGVSYGDLSVALVGGSGGGSGSVGGSGGGGGGAIEPEPLEMLNSLIPAQSRQLAGRAGYFFLLLSVVAVRAAASWCTA
jgi:hypothetical protein